MGEGGRRVQRVANVRPARYAGKSPTVREQRAE
jgi:hypothetical protein